MSMVKKDKQDVLKLRRLIHVCEPPLLCIYTRGTKKKNVGADSPFAMCMRSVASRMINYYVHAKCRMSHDKLQGSDVRIRVKPM